MSGMPNSDNNSLSNRVYRHLRDGIADGRYPTGEYLVEQTIAKELGVSRTPVREAIKQLELEDLVSSQPNRGVVVTGFTSEDVLDVYTIRYLLEGQAAYWAAERITDEQIKRMREIMELMEFYTRKNDIEHVTSLDTQFHSAIYEACNSRTLKNILASLHRNIMRARQSSLTIPNRASVSLVEHRNIFDALASRNAQQAMDYTKQHISSAWEYNKPI